MSCQQASSSSQALFKAAVHHGEGACPRVRHLLTGTFNTRFLHLLSFDSLTRTLSVLATLPAQGPHSFLASGRSSSAPSGRLVDRVYATTWAAEKTLSAWSINWKGENPELQWVNTVPITATSSYVHVQPPPYFSKTSPSYGLPAGSARYLYSAGGPTGEVHAIDANTGALQEKTQEIVFLPGGEKDLDAADKTRKALRYGAHNLDVGKGSLAYVADLGRNAVLTYQYDAETGLLGRLLSETTSPDAGDGPRHVVPSPDGHWVFAITEHTSYLDVYRQEVAPQSLKHVQRLSLLPSHVPISDYRGDTVRLSPSGNEIFATTRGKSKAIKGFVTAWKLDWTAHLSPIAANQEPLARLETPTSGGKANAIEFAPRYTEQPDQVVANVDDASLKDLAVLTDDEQGYIYVLEWNGSDLVEVARTKLPGKDEDDESEPEKASHAIWLS